MTKPIPLASFRVPAGMVGTTLDLHGCKPVTLMVEAARLEELLAVVERAFGLSPMDRTSTREHCRLRWQLRAQLRRAQRTRDDAALSGLGPVALWLALNHPDAAEAARRHVSAALCRDEGARITISSNRRGLWGFAVGQEFVDLGGVMAEMRGLDRTIGVERVIDTTRAH